MFSKSYTINKKNLDRLDVLINDTSIDSPNYFNIQTFPNTLTSGKNLIEILGIRNKLVPNTKVYVEITDINNEAVYYKIPIKKGDNNSRYIIPYIFYDTPIGIGKVTLIGTAKYDLNGKKITGKWANTTNIRWSRNININRSVRNNTEILFDNEPNISINKIDSTKQTIIQPAGVTASDGYVSYEVVNNMPFVNSHDFEFTSDMLHGSISVPSPDIGSSSEPVSYNTSITDIISSTNVKVNDFYKLTSNPFTPITRAFKESAYELTYLPPTAKSTVTETETKAYLKVDINNMKLLSGDVYRSRLYFKDDNYDGNYELLDDFVYEDYQMLTDNADINNIVNYGLFDSGSILTYWSASYLDSVLNLETLNEYIITDDGDRLTTEADVFLVLNQDVSFTDDQISETINHDIMLNSVLLESDTTFDTVFMYYKQNDSITYKDNVDYLLDFNFYVSNYAGELELLVYASGSAFPTDNPVGIKMLHKLVNQNTNNNVQCNIKPNASGTGHIIFKLRSDKSWYLNNINLYSKIDNLHNQQTYSKFIATPLNHLSSSLSFKLEYFNYENTQAITSSYTNIGDSVTYTEPTLDLTLDVLNESTTIFEIGEAVNVDLTSSFVQNDAGSVSSRDIKRDSTTLTTTLSDDNVYYSDTNVEITDSIQYMTTVNYTQGDIKLNSIGEAFPYGRIAEGILTDSQYLYGKYYVFTGVSSSDQSTHFNDNTWVRSSNNYQDKHFLNTTGTTTFDIEVSDEDLFTWIIAPSTYNVTSIKLVESSYAEIIGSFSSSIVEIEDGGGTALSCIAQSELLDVPNSSNVIYRVIVQKT